MNYTYAKQIGEYLCKELEEVCLPGYCQIAGSVRREKADCGDLELVVIPIPGAPRPEFGRKRPPRAGVILPGIVQAFGDAD
jgi:hypothetical protein